MAPLSQILELNSNKNQKSFNQCRDVASCSTVPVPAGAANWTLSSTMVEFSFLQEFNSIIFFTRRLNSVFFLFIEAVMLKYLK